MKILCSGDWHIRASATKYRTADYYNLMFEKLGWIIKFATKYKCYVILQPGDFFDGPDIPNHVNQQLIGLILKYFGDIYTVFGQHDTKFRQKNNTALAVLQAAEVVDILNDDPIEYEEKKLVHIYGASWEAKIPKPTNKEACNILVLHKMIVKDKPLFQEQTDFMRSKDFLKKYSNYNLIVAGDNHNSFMVSTENNNTILVNCGSLMRMTTTQYEHKPHIYLFDTITNKITQHYLPIKPTSEVFKPEADEMKKRDEKMEAFVKTLVNTNTDSQLSFEDNLKILLSHKTISQKIRELANEFIGKYYEGESI